MHSFAGFLAVEDPFHQVFPQDIILFTIDIFKNKEYLPFKIIKNKILSLNFKTTPTKHLNYLSLRHILFFKILHQPEEVLPNVN
ncbi:hypothetical protein CIN01S_10_00410 [Chryseobacterium indologenes NBRC 14944]|nr:hypothetical protein CIN01S_10_00410 [Chryseobacterium indologenes NBRC 14944]